MLDHCAVFAGELDGQLARSGKTEIGGTVLVAEGVAADDDWLRPAGHQPGHVLHDDGFAENHAAKNVADRAIGRAPHFLEAELLDACLIRRDGGTFDTNAVLFDGVGRVDGNLVVGVVACLDSKVVIFQIDVKIGVDQLVLDELPDNAGHLVAIQFDDRVFDLDLRHLGNLL